MDSSGYPWHHGTRETRPAARVPLEWVGLAIRLRKKIPEKQEKFDTVYDWRVIRVCCTRPGDGSW